MTRYEPDREGEMMDDPTGDYVRYEVAQALYDSLESCLLELERMMPSGASYPCMNAARAALALAEKKGDA